MATNPLKKLNVHPRLRCSSFGASDYCAACGEPMTEWGPCSYKMATALADFTDEHIKAWGCDIEAFCVSAGDTSDEAKCDRWCRNYSRCPVTFTDAGRLALQDGEGR